MKICVVISSEEFRSSAGMRIRYQRFMTSLFGQSTTIDVEVCTDLAGSDLDHDCYIFCKTFDCTALLLARRARKLGKIVGQDLFDDYFSQADDGRLGRFREWLTLMAEVTQFAVCSTPRMAEIVGEYIPGVPITAIDDPAQNYDPLMIASIASSKAATALALKTIDFCWFGIGDNPFFPAGISDLTECASVLAEIEDAGWQVRLNIVTNQRPFEGAGAEILRDLSCNYILTEWTPAAEQRALLDATVAIIPVNTQSFSRAKSMNRAITALSAGCQVLSLGFPLYDKLHNLIYRHAERLLTDLTDQKMLVRADTIDNLNRAFTKFANPYDAAQRFVAIAREASHGEANAPYDRTICFINGFRSSIAEHKFASKVGLSIYTFFSKARWNFPIRFEVDVVGRLEMLVSPAAVRRFDPAVRKDRSIRIGESDYMSVDLDKYGISPKYVYLDDRGAWKRDGSLYSSCMNFIENCCHVIIGDADVIVSDLQPRVRHTANAGLVA